MTQNNDGGLSLKLTDLLKLSIKKSFKNRKAAATFAKSFRKSVNRDAILRWTTTTKLAEYEGYCVLTVTIASWGGISAKTLAKLEELLNT